MTYYSQYKIIKEKLAYLGGVSAFLIYRLTQESRICADTTLLLTCK